MVANNGTTQEPKLFIIRHFCLMIGDPGGTRTHDPLIKSQLLYQLSYGVAIVIFELRLQR